MYLLRQLSLVLDSMNLSLHVKHLISPSDMNVHTVQSVGHFTQQSASCSQLYITSGIYVNPKQQWCFKSSSSVAIYPFLVSSIMSLNSMPPYSRAYLEDVPQRFNPPVCIAPSGLPRAARCFVATVQLLICIAWMKFAPVRRTVPLLTQWCTKGTAREALRLQPSTAQCSEFEFSLGFRQTVNERVARLERRVCVSPPLVCEGAQVGNQGADNRSCTLARRSSRAFLIRGIVNLNVGIPSPPSRTSLWNNTFTASWGSFSHDLRLRRTSFSNRFKTPPLLCERTSLWYNLGTRWFFRKYSCCCGLSGALVRWFSPRVRSSLADEPPSRALTVIPSYLEPSATGTVCRVPPVKDTYGVGSQTQRPAFPSTAIVSDLDLSGFSARPQRPSAPSSCRLRCWMPILLLAIRTMSSAKARWLRRGPSPPTRTPISGSRASIAQSITQLKTHTRIGESGSPCFTPLFWARGSLISSPMCRRVAHVTYSWHVNNKKIPSRKYDPARNPAQQRRSERLAWFKEPVTGLDHVEAFWLPQPI